MALPPPPVSDNPGSFAWLEWYRQLRNYISQTGSVPWAVVDKAGSNITDIVSRAHNNLQSPQGGTSGQYYHLTSAQHTTLTGLPTIDQGTYTPTLTNVTNLDSSTAYSCQYLRVGSTVTVSGRVDVNPTAAASALTQLGISLPIASNIANTNECGGTAIASAVAGNGAILGDATNNRAELNFLAGFTTDQPMYFTFTYRII